MFTNIEMLTNTELLLEMFTIPLPHARSFSLLDQPSLAFLSPVFILMVSVLDCVHLIIKHISQAYFVKTIFNIETHIMREKNRVEKSFLNPRIEGGWHTKLEKSSHTEACTA